MKDRSSLPDFLRPLFWDTDFDRLRTPGHEPYIIERVLEYGDDPSIRWLVHAFDRRAIADIVRQSRVLSPNTANLWALVLDIPREEVRCFSKRFRITSNVF